MGYTTDFVGNLTITPRLNEEEIDYLQAFFDSRRCQRPGGSYDVPGNPRAEDLDDFDRDDYNTRAPGQPDLWCGWSICWDGDCLAWSGVEKSYAMVAWLRYLIAHFLKPGAKAAGDPRFAAFTFDHRVNGMVVGCRRDTKELFAMTVSDNVVRERVLSPGNPAWASYPDLPYEIENDLWAEPPARRRRRRGTRSEGGEVVAPAER
jgi:hypothetical protein